MSKGERKGGRDREGGKDEQKTGGRVRGRKGGRDEETTGKREIRMKVRTICPPDWQECEKMELTKRRTRSASQGI